MRREIDNRTWRERTLPICVAGEFLLELFQNVKVRKRTEFFIGGSKVMRKNFATEFDFHWSRMVNKADSDSPYIEIMENREDGVVIFDVMEDLDR